MLKELKIGENYLRSLIPTFSERQRRLDQRWETVAEKSGLTSICRRREIEDLSVKREIGNLTELPPFLRIGRLSLEKKYQVGEFTDVQAYLKSHDVPALVNYREKSAILTFSELDHRRISKLIQRQIIQLICNLDPSVVSCKGIDLQGFGADFGLLTAAVPSFDAITDPRNLDDFFREIPELVKQRNKIKSFAFEYLYDYNKAHRDSAAPYLFVFISAYDRDLDKDQKLIVDKLLSNDNSAKAGIYFVINFVDRVQLEAFSERHVGLPRVLEFGQSELSASLEVLDPVGLDTSAGGPHEILQVTQDTDDLNVIKSLTETCNRHLKMPRLDPVVLGLPTSLSWGEAAWRHDSSLGFSVPIGKARGSEVVFELGGEHGIVHNALIGGAVGTGKTNLVQSILLQTLAKYSPEEVGLSILDYKSGTEFSLYKDVPHLYAISLGGGIKFGIDLLAHFQKELERRASLFKQNNVSNLADFRRKTGEKLVRHLIVIDEFQVLFSESETAKSALEDLIRRGRSFGFNFILSSQSLKDASLTSPTKAQIGLRICLRLSEADCSEFLSIGNDLPTRFTYPGQAVYNDQEGRSTANLEFRVAYYSSATVSEFFSVLRAKAQEAGLVSSKAYVYEGDHVAAKSQIEVMRQPEFLYLGYQDGIPQIQKFLALDPSTGPILVIGSGVMRNVFERHLKDEIKYLPSGYCTEVESSDAESYLHRLQSFEIDPPKLLVLYIKSREARSSSIQSALGDLAAQSSTKLMLVVDSKASLSSLFWDIRSAAAVVYLDQKSIDGYGNELKGQNGAIAAQLPDDDELVVVKIPALG